MTLLQDMCLDIVPKKLNPPDTEFVFYIYYFILLLVQCLFLIKNILTLCASWANRRVCTKMNFSLYLALLSITLCQTSQVRSNQNAAIINA